MKKWLLFAALAALSYPAQAQNAPPATPATFKQILSGSLFPVTVKMKEMKPEEWRRFSMAGGSEGGLSSYIAMMSMGMGNGGGGEMPSADIIYYTKGDTVTLGAETFLVAYRPQLKQPDMMNLMLQSQNNGGKNPAPEQLMPEKMTTESSVALALLNIRNIQNLADIKPFDFKQEIADNEAAAKALFDVLQAGMAAQNAGGAEAAEPEKPLVAPKVRAAIAADKTLTADGNAIAVEEGESLITLRGMVKTETVKKHAEEVVKKLFKEQSLAFKIDNQLEVTEKSAEKKPTKANVAPKPAQKKKP